VLRCCRLKVEDVAPYGVALTGPPSSEKDRPAREVELTEPTRDAVDVLHQVNRQRSLAIFCSPVVTASPRYPLGSMRACV